VGEDKYHFAQEYARRALAALDGQRPARPRTAENSLRQALEWFPEETTWACAVDVGVCWANRPFRIQPPPGADPASPVQKPFALDLSLIRGEHQEEIYQAAERVGNVRLDRIALGSPTPPQLESTPPQPDRQGIMMVRMTG